MGGLGKGGEVVTVKICKHFSRIQISELLLVYPDTVSKDCMPFFRGAEVVMVPR